MKLVVWTRNYGTINPEDHQEIERLVGPYTVLDETAEAPSAWLVPDTCPNTGYQWIETEQDPGPAKSGLGSWDNVMIFDDNED